MMPIIGSSSTRNKLKPQAKNIKSARFFKRMPTDENQKNTINYLEKIHNHNHNYNNYNIKLCTEKPKKSSHSTQKKSFNNLTHLSTKNLKTTNSTTNLTTSTRHLHNESRQKQLQRKYKNLKLSGSIQFPKILVKSISQTTMHKKSEDKTLRLLEKIGGIQKKRLKKKSSCLMAEIKIGNFRLGRKLGNGRFGSVYMAEDKNSNMIVAIKVLNKAKIKQAQMQDQIIMQIKLQSFMNHPNILKLYGYFHDNKNIYLILEYCSQCLFKDFRAKEKFEEAETAYYGKQAISALKYMHNQSIMHRDIKPENILLEFGVLKVSDFGWSIYSPTYKRQTFCGTVDYVPPEIIQGVSYDERVDIWALGILLYQLSSGKAPFENRDQNTTYQKIVKSECKYPTHFSEQLISLIRKILDKNPKRRPDLEEIENDRWFEQYKTVGRFIAKPIWSAWNNL